MSWLQYIRSFAFPRNLAPGTQTAPISLTAQDGSWIQTRDLLGNSTVLLIGCKNPTDSKTISWLSSFSSKLPDFDQAHIKLFIICANTPQVLRDIHTKHNLRISMLYDPLALEARKFGLSGRRPWCRDGLVLIDKNGVVLRSACGQGSPDEWMEKTTNTPSSTTTTTNPILMLSTQETESLLEQGAVLVDVRTLSEYEPDHVPNSLHIPVDELPKRYNEIGQTHRIIFICQAGGRAYSAAEFMNSIGATDIFVVEGGMSGWSGTRNTAGTIS